MQVQRTTYVSTCLTARDPLAGSPACERRVTVGTGCTGKFQPLRQHVPLGKHHLILQACSARRRNNHPSWRAFAFASRPMNWTNDHQPQSQEPPVALGLAGRRAQGLLATPRCGQSHTVDFNSAPNCCPVPVESANDGCIHCQLCSANSHFESCIRPIWDLQIHISNQNVRGNAFPSPPRNTRGQ